MFVGLYVIHQLRIVKLFPQYLQEITSVNVRSDFDPGFLQFLIPVCFAQAQECIAEKSISGNRKLNISGKKKMLCIVQVKIE